ESPFESPVDLRRSFVQPWNADNPPLRSGLSTFLFLFAIGPRLPFHLRDSGITANVILALARNRERRNDAIGISRKFIGCMFQCPNRLAGDQGVRAFKTSDESRYCHLRLAPGTPQGGHGLRSELIIGVLHESNQHRRRAAFL